jgi:hypothetical protein
MAVTVQCPNPACGKSSRVPDDFLGHALRCSHCRHKFVLSADGSPRPAAADRTLAADGKDTDGSGERPSSPPPSETSLPRQIGRFQVRERLGAGAHGAVFRAFDPQLDREVALKVPRADALDSPRRVERFLREAKAAALLRHPNIVPVYDAGRDADHYYIASAYVKGRTLSEASDAGSLDLRRAVRVVRDLAEALAYAHEQGIRASRRQAVQRDARRARTAAPDGLRSGRPP